MSGVFPFVIRHSCFVILLAEQERTYGELAVEPAAGLIERFTDEVGRELRLKLFRAAIGNRISPLGERHCAGVVPAVNHLRHTLHPSALRKRRVVLDGVDVRLVNPQVVR